MVRFVLVLLLVFSTPVLGYQVPSEREAIQACNKAGIDFLFQFLMAKRSGMTLDKAREIAKDDELLKAFVEAEYAGDTTAANRALARAIDKCINDIRSMGASK